MVGRARPDWLRLARVDRVLDHAEVGETELRAFQHAVGFTELCRTDRDWALPAATDC